VSLPAFGVRKPVVANLVMFAILGAGLIFGMRLRREFFPEIRPNQVLVTAPWPGAAPEDVEDALATKIEDRVADLRGVKEINTTVAPGAANLRIEFEDGYPIDEAVADVKREMDALQDLPPDADRILVDKFEPNLPVIILSLYGDAPEREMKRAIRSIRDDLVSLDGMGDVVVGGTRTDEISVEVSPGAMLEHRLSFPAIAGRIHEAMLELPGGSVRSPTQNVSVRAPGADERAADVREIVVKAGGEGQVLRVGDIAAVSDSFADIDVFARLNGQPAMSLTILKIGDEDAVEMADLVKAYVTGRRGEPLKLTAKEKLTRLFRRPGDDRTLSRRVAAYDLGLSRADDALPGELALTTDLARFIRGRLDLLTRNALMGGVLVFLTLLLLLNWRVSLWVALGLVVSMAGTLAVMNLAGITLNLLTMFGLIIVIGILVDDAIVVAENITSRHEEGEPAEQAAIHGAEQVLWPVFVTVTTTICAFLPLGLIEGMVGDMLAALPIVVACSLSVSMIEALFILPAHMAHSLRRNDQRGRAGRFARLEARFDRARDALFNRVVIPAYSRAVSVCLRARYLTIACAIALVIVSLGLVVGGRIPFSFIGTADSETINADLRMPVGTPASVTDEALRRLESAALALPEVDSCWVVGGAVQAADGSEPGAVASNLGQVILELKPVELRDRSATDVELAWRHAIGVLPGIKSLRIAQVSGGPGGADINLGVTGDDPRMIERAAADLEEALVAYPSVYDVSDDADAGQRELRITLRDGASELGFTNENLGQQVRGAVLGLEAFTFAGEREDVDVRVMAPESIRRNLAAVEEMYVFAPGGTPVPLAEVARLDEAEGYATVRRLDRKRVVTVTADVDAAQASTEEVVRSLQPELHRIQSSYPGVRIIERGRQKDVAESFATMPIGLAAAIGMILVLLAWLFQSYIQPLLVITAIPFAAIGVIWGHLILGYDLMILSMIGFIALSGIVVNDSLIFVDFYNQMRERGHGVHRACVEAGRARIRAILLTTITTILGLLPLLLEPSFQAQFLKPMAITITCGLASATAIILIVLPCFLAIYDDARRALTFAWTGRRIPPDPPESPDPVPA